jgi:hypothetical protein
MRGCINECLYPNCSCPRPVSDTVMQTIFEKPTYQEQLNYLSSLGDSVMIRAIKENVIVVRNYEKATDSQS